MAYHRPLPALTTTASHMTPVAKLVPVQAFFFHQNRDGSFDAICTKCLSTVGTAFRRSKLLAIERAHKCEPSLLVDITHHCWTC
jgi:hypothetical protein